MKGGSRRSGRIIQFLAIAVSLLAAVPNVYPSGRQADQAGAESPFTKSRTAVRRSGKAGLSRIDSLIEAKEYNKAIEALTGYIEDNPDNFDLAQERLRYIFMMRNEYDAIANEILDILIADPNDAERILALSRQLEDIETGQDTTSQTFLKRVRDIALFSVNRTRLENILVQGRALIDQKDYSGAVAAYVSGLDLYWDEFFEGGYGKEVENRVSRGRIDINGNASSFTALAPQVRRTAAEAAQIGRQAAVVTAEDLPKVEALYDKFIPEIEELSRTMDTLQSVAAYYGEQLTLLQAEDDTLGDRSFLSFASRLVHGRSGEGVPEGILGAVEGLLSDSVADFENSLTDLTGKSYASALDSMDRGESQNFFRQLETLSAYTGMSLDLLEKSGQAVEDRPADYLKFQAMDQAVTFLRQGESLGEQYRSLSVRAIDPVPAWRRGTVSAQDAIEQEKARRETFQEAARTVDDLLSEIQQDLESLEVRRAAAEAPDAVLDPVNKAGDRVRNLKAFLDRQYENSTVAQYTIANGELEEELNRRIADFDRGNQLLEGVEQETGESQGYLARHPSQALAIFSAMEKELAGNIRSSQELMDAYRAENPALLAGDEMAGLYSSGQSIAGLLESLNARTLASAASARNRVIQAEDLRLEGNRFYQEAQDALARNNFEIARGSLMRAGDRYDQSLALEESAALRTERDTRLLSLGDEIARLENEMVVREVRNLVNNARNVYLAGGFEQAEETLVRAQTLWQSVNQNDNDEITYWLVVVRGALYLKTGRNIPTTAPLYAEMSQLLSDARRFYDEGVRLLNSSRRAEGLAKFAEARKKTQEVRLMFPVNEDAGILELMIDQVTDPDTFAASFQRRFNEAVAGARRRSQESFADLQNLAKINPRYPGMTAAVSQAEVDMGYKLPPPDPAMLSRSGELAASARRIIEGNIRSQFSVALEQLNQALRLNPNNTQAMSLKDRVQTEVGGSAAVLLSSADEREYQRAIQAFQRGNKIDAITIVRQLLQDPRNRNSARILELQRRIESIL